MLWICQYQISDFRWIQGSCCIFLDMTPCSLVVEYKILGVKYCLYLLSWRTEDGSSIFLRSVNTTYKNTVWLCKSVVLLLMLNITQWTQFWYKHTMHLNIVTCQPIVGLRNRALLGSRPLNASRPNTRYAAVGKRCLLRAVSSRGRLKTGPCRVALHRSVSKATTCKQTQSR
jgi:hypothetical protein